LSWLIAGVVDTLSCKIGNEKWKVVLNKVAGCTERNIFLKGVRNIILFKIYEYRPMNNVYYSIITILKYFCCIVKL